MLDRRKLLKAVAATGAAGAGLLPVGRSAFAALSDASAVAPPRLVVVFMRGAVDGLSVVVPYAEDKRRRKNLDLIAANRVGVAGSGFGSEQNELHVLWEGGEQVLPLAEKTLLGQQLVALIAARYRCWKGER